ncbi:myelin-associated glycoprotein isoform X4 [Scleropages formosus]|uniref:myelin-associated glycoprotein isoform X4 n=1 Tax=Scleropages formosus TaxID=113540 RepID=UPI0010FABCEC|nr:myelin-associated glycoprotein-like isoform X4 [Scleropages formosus]
MLGETYAGRNMKRPHTLGLMKEVLLSSITISIPEQVSALSGSCVVIPCSFTVQPPRIARGKPVKYHIRLRYPYGLFSRWRTAFSNEDTTEVERSFRGRTSLTGDPSKGDCSVRIDRVRKEDANQYEVALKERGASEWKTTISVSVSVSDTPVRPVISDPGTITEGQLVTLNCTVIYSCPGQPPQLRWRWEKGGQENSSQYQEQVPPQPHQQKLVLHTSVSFHASHLAPPRIKCLAGYGDKWTASATKELHIRYKPLISETSSCQWDGWTILCQCVVDSNPRPAVTWSVNGSNPPDSYNTSVSATGGTVAARLNGGTGQQPNVVCYAHNALGNDSATLLAGSKDSLLWKVVPASAILVSLFLFASILFLLHCRRKTGKHMLKYRHPSVYPGNLGVYHYHSPIYINCSEVTHIYTNGSYQLVYQNCTPIFVQNKQWRHQRERRVVWSDGPPREIQTPGNDPENAIYLEVI